MSDRGFFLDINNWLDSDLIMNTPSPTDTYRKGLTNLSHLILHLYWFHIFTLPRVVSKSKDHCFILRVIKDRKICQNQKWTLKFYLVENPLKTLKGNFLDLNFRTDPWTTAKQMLKKNGVACPIHKGTLKTLITER